jgi:hypothetical protein
MTVNLGRILVAATGAALLHFLAGGSASADDTGGSRIDQRVRIGFDIAKEQGVTLNQDMPSQGLGSYLVTSLGCNDCHTWPNYTPDGNPYNRQKEQVNITSYLAGGRLFSLPPPVGDICSRNITPAKGTDLPAGLTRQQFIYVIRTGCDPQDENFNDPQSCGLLQVMPWPGFSKTLRQQEISAIYDYLSALPHRDPGPQCMPDPQGVADNQ